jgi:hypothetical protein
LGFQIVLSEALRALVVMYNRLNQEQKQVVSRKGRVSKSWFLERLRAIARYQNAVDQAISTGKILGDGFAWMFYSEERDYLAEHWQHPPIPHIPGGSGGIGELEIIKRIRVYKDHLLLYHGITSFLRLGDVSLVNLKTLGVSALGEIKTTEVGRDELRSSLTMIGPGVSTMLDLRGAPSHYGKPSSPFSRKVEDRLAKQLKKIAASFAHSRSVRDKDLCSTGTFWISALNSLGDQLKTRDHAFSKAGDGLLLCAFRNRRRLLSSRIMLSPVGGHSRMLGHTVREARRIIAKNSTDNSLRVAPFLYSSHRYSLLRGTVPPVWWPLDLEFLRSLIFREITVATVFNPLHLVRKLRSAGFKVAEDRRSGRLRITKQLRDGRPLQIKNFTWFLALIRSHFHTEDDIVDMLCKVVSECNEQASDGCNLRVTMDIRQVFERSE